MRIPCLFECVLLSSCRRPPFCSSLTCRMARWPRCWSSTFCEHRRNDHQAAVVEMNAREKKYCNIFQKRIRKLNVWRTLFWNRKNTTLDAFRLQEAATAPSQRSNKHTHRQRRRIDNMKARRPYKVEYTLNDCLTECVEPSVH